MSKYKDNPKSNRPEESQFDTDKAWRIFEDMVRDEEVPAVWNQTGQEDLNRGEPTAYRKAQPPVTENEAGASESAENTSAMHSYARRLRKKRLYKLGTTAAAVLLIAGFLTTGWGDRVMAAVMQTFRIQHIQTVQFSMDDFRSIETAIENGTGGTQNLSLEQFGTIQTQGGGQTQQLTVSQAEKNLGYPIKTLPGISAEQQQVELNPHRQITLKLHVDHINSLITGLGGKTLFPQSIDGQPIVVHIPNSMTVQSTDTSERRVLNEMAAPSIQVPNGVNADQVRTAVLQLPFLPSSIRRQIEGIADWKDTLFLPLPQKSGKPITLAGHQAVLYNQPGYHAIMWLNAGHIYMYTESGKPTSSFNEKHLMQSVQSIMEQS